MMVKNCSDIGENLKEIASRLLSNQEICKLCHYTDKDPLNKPDFSLTECHSFLHKYVKIIPRFDPQETANSHIIISVASGLLDDANPDFRIVKLVIYVNVPLKQWVIKNENLRPFLLLGAIQKSLNGKKVNGLGTLHGGDFMLNNLTEDMSCYTIEFNITNYA